MDASRALAGQAGSFLRFQSMQWSLLLGPVSGLIIEEGAGKVSLSVLPGASKGNTQLQDGSNLYWYCPGAQNIMKLADGLFIRCTREVSEK